MSVDAVLLAVRDGGLRVVLSPAAEAGPLALPGCTVRPDEDLDAAVRRAVRQSGVPVPHLEQLASYGSPRRVPGSRVVSVAYLGLLAAGAAPSSTADHDAGTFPLDVVDPPGALAFDHARIVADGVERAR
ncbi:MAG: NUDIX domain-containing protein, partial [Candidatus Limnocylindrales bacterium]